MDDDLIERLRSRGLTTMPDNATMNARFEPDRLCVEAANEIERLSLIAAAAEARAEADRVTMEMIGDVLHVDGPDLAARVTVAGRSMTVAELIAAHERAQWQPIETAPRDGSAVWVYAAPRDGLSGFQCWCVWHQDAGWCVDELRIVTHWRPLPEPPAPTETEGA